MWVLPVNLGWLRLESELWALHCALDFGFGVLGSMLHSDLPSGSWAELGWALGPGPAIYRCCSDLLSLLPLALGLGNLNIDLLTLGQLLTCPLLDFADQINQVGPPGGRR